MTASETRPMPVPALEKKSLSGPQGELTARSSRSFPHQNPVSGSLNSKQVFNFDVDNLMTTQ